MVDHRDSVGGAQCADLRASIELLAVDALTSEESEALLAHVEGCPDCRAALERAADGVGRLLLVAPDAEVPPGFTERVVAAGPAPGTAGPAAFADDGRGRGRRSSRWIALAVACVVVAMVLVAVGTIVGTGRDGDRAEGPSTSEPAARSAPLVTAGGATVGSVVVDDGDPATLRMAVELALPGVPYDCVVRTGEGDLVTVGSWTAGSVGAADWTVTLDPALGPVEEVHLVVGGADTVAVARLA